MDRFRRTTAFLQKSLSGRQQLNRHRRGGRQPRDSQLNDRKPSVRMRLCWCARAPACTLTLIAMQDQSKASRH